MNKSIIVLTGHDSEYENTLYFEDLEQVELWLKSSIGFCEGRSVGNWYEVFVQKSFSKYLERKDIWKN